MHPLRRDLRAEIQRVVFALTIVQQLATALSRFAPYIDTWDIEALLTNVAQALANAQEALTKLSNDFEAWSTKMEKPE